MTNFRINNDYMCVDSTASFSGARNHNLIIVIDKGFRNMCNLSYKNGWISVLNCLMHSSVSKICLARPDTLSEDDRALLRRIPTNLIELINSIATEMKKVVLPEPECGFRSINIRLVLKEILDDSMCNYLVPYSRFAKIVKYEKDVEQLFSEIFEAIHPSINKAYTSVIFQRDQIPDYIPLAQI